MEWNSIRISSHAHGIVAKTLHKLYLGSLSCLSKTEPCAVVSNQSSSKLRGEVVCYPHCMLSLVFLVLMLLIVQDCRLK